MSARNRGGPLAGVRVLEITKVWAGPYAGKMLAFLGAEVIKVESKSNLDEMRAYGGVDIDSAPYFVSINQEIKSVQVNMKSEEGLALLRRMIAESDILIDNLRPGAMARLGLGYDAVKQIKPDIIQAAIKMYGTDGPLGYQTGYAPCFAAISGITSLVGHDGEPPKGMNIRYGDSTVGLAAAFASVIALHHRALTGEGQFIDVSAVETLSSMMGDSLMAHAMTGIAPAADENRHAEMAPHNFYPCSDASWIAICAADDEEWSALCSVLGVADLKNDPRFATMDARLAHRDALDDIIRSATMHHDPAQLLAALHGANVPATRAMSSLDLLGDEFLWASGAFRSVTDSLGRERPVIGPGWRMTPDEADISRGAPLLGEHNGYVYTELLGLSQAELDDLIARKVVD